MKMKWKRRIVYSVLLFVSLLVICSCVSKKDYLLKVDESKKLSMDLEELKSDHNMLEEQKKACDTQVIALQGEKSDLEKMRTQLQLKTLSLEKENARLKGDNLELEEILKAKSDTLSKNIVDLRDHIADLKKENSLLKAENKDLSQNLETLQIDLNNFRDQIVALQKKNEVLQFKTKDLERQKEEEVLAMKGTYENLLENMKSEIEKGKITITQLRGKLKVNMLDEILFDSGETTINPQGIEVLKRVGNILLNVKDKAINIEGHTDNVPIGAELSKKYPTNWELSMARATNVARYLQEKSGINPILLSATGYGEYKPIASNETEEGKAKNRRIEIVLVPKEIVPVSRK
jgi:chemotaxis protein MotB